MTKDIEYLITIKYEGTKTFKIHAESFDEALEVAQCGPEHRANPTADYVSETIMKIERLEEDK